MVGISYPGITQLFVAATRPPHLAAITPLSVLDDTYDTLYPGGIFNNGFALGWAKDRQADAAARRRRAAVGGEAHRRRRHDLRGNQALRLQAADVHARDRARLGTDAAPATDALAPATFVDEHRRARCSSPARGRTRRPAATSPNMLGDFAPGIP